MALQLIGIAILAWAAISPSEANLSRPVSQLVMLVLAGIAIVILQLVPLPPALWSHLGGRREIASGYAILQIPIPWLPVSLTPYKALDSLFALIPPLAAFFAMTRLGAYRNSLLVAAIVAGTISGVLLGTLQVSSAEPRASPWYLYADSNFQSATGFFANANHMATLLLISLPYLAALIATGRAAKTERYIALILLAAGMGLVVVIGLALNGSLAGYGLVLPVLMASALIVMPPSKVLRTWMLVAGSLLLVAGLVALATSSIGSENLGEEAATSVQSRKVILATTEQAIVDFMPWGSGLGSFQQVYALYENPDQVTSTYVVHAHNDYAEIALETGIPGIIVMFSFLFWWVTAAARSWRDYYANDFARAASIASGAMLVHSLVDFPLRETALSTCFAISLALLVGRGDRRDGDKSDLRQRRHIEFR